MLSRVWVANQSARKTLSTGLVYTNTVYNIYIYIYIYTWIFENGITNFTPRPGWTRCHRQRVHLRLAVYFLGGGGLSRLVPSNSTGTGLTDHLHLGSPHLNPEGVGLVKTRVFSLISTDFLVIVLASQAHWLNSEPLAKLFCTQMNSSFLPELLAVAVPVSWHLRRQMSDSGGGMGQHTCRLVFVHVHSLSSTLWFAGGLMLKSWK